MKIDFKDDTPRYQQLVNLLTRKIKDEQLKPGEKIPSENELTDQLGVSRSTVRQALEEMVQSGILEKRKGLGTFVRGDFGKHQDGRSFLIGVIMPTLKFTIYPQIIQGIEAVCQGNDYSVILGNSNASEEGEVKLLEQMISRGIDGLIIEPTHSALMSSQSRNFRLLNELSIPLVVIDNPAKGLHCSQVILDDEFGGEAAVNFLVQKGHQRIAIIYKDDVVAGVSRKAGYSKALINAGLEERSEYVCRYNETDEPFSPSVVHTKKLMSLPEPPTAIFYFNDEIAFQGFKTLKGLGIKVPDDVSIIGFDDIPMASFSEIPLTSFRHPKYLMGKWAADILFDSLEQRDPSLLHQILIRPSLVIRNSVSTFPC